MKNLLIFLLIVAGVGLYFHDKQQTANLTKAQADLDAAQTQNSDLTQKVNNLQAQVASMQARLQQQSTATSLQPQPTQQRPPAGNSPFGQSRGLPPSSLDRGAYRN